MTKKLLIFFFILGQMVIQAQEQYLIVNTDSISATDFKEKYKANIEAEGIQQAVDNYIDFKLISQHALNSKVDTTSYYRNNWQNYFDQESKKYLESETLKKELAASVYEKLKTQKNVELFALSYQNPFNAKETTAKKEELIALRKKVCQEQDSVALTTFRKKNKSRPFWLKPFTVPYQIEDLIYNTPVGSCSPLEEHYFTIFFIKVLGEKKTEDLPPYQQIEEQIMTSLAQSSYREVIQKDLVERIKQKVNITEDKTALREVLNAVKKPFKQNQTITFAQDKPIWQTPYSQYSQQDLIAFFKDIMAEGNSHAQTDFIAMQSYFIPLIKEDFIVNSYKENLPALEPALKDKLDLMSETLYANYFIETHIYAKAKRDSLGQQAYLKQNQDKYIWPKRYDLSVYRYYNAADQKALLKMIKQNKPADYILKKFNEGKSQPAVVISKGKFVEGHKDLPPHYNGNKKITQGKYLTQNAFFVLHKTIPSGPMSIEDAGNTFIEAYKSKYYNKVLQELRKDAKISIPKALNE